MKRLKHTYKCKQCKQVIALIDYCGDGLCIGCRRQNSIDNAAGLWIPRTNTRKEEEAKE